MARLSHRVWADGASMTALGSTRPLTHRAALPLTRTHKSMHTFLASASSTSVPSLMGGSIDVRKRSGLQTVWVVVASFQQRAGQVVLAGMVSALVWHAVHRVPGGTPVMRRS